MNEELAFKEPFSGLRSTDIEVLLKKFGKNRFRQKHRLRFFRIIWDVVKEPMFLLLVGACFLYFILGENQEGFMMLGAVLLVSALSMYQQARSSRALKILQNITEPFVTVIRNQAKQGISAQDLLPGDLLIIEEGNMVPADGTVVEAHDLTVNESVVTGESLPVEKNVKPSSNRLYQGTTVNSGKGLCIVTETGNSTFIGKLGKTVELLANPKTLLQVQLTRFVQVMAIMGIGAFGIIWLVNYMRNGDMISSLLFGLTLAMAAIPEEIPVAFSSFMALGAAEMSKLGIITREAKTVENLGAVNVICVDKTGTITENNMTLKKVYDFSSDSVEEFDGVTIKNNEVLKFARLACELDPFDAMEKAIVNSYKHICPEDIQDYSLIHEYPLTGFPPMMTHVYQYGDSWVVAGKGAPEKIISVCALDKAGIDLVTKVSGEMTSSGYRVLGISKSSTLSGRWPESQDDFDWQFLGLIGLYDPPKQNVNKVFKDWLNAGINIKIISGDSPSTVANISKQVGLTNVTEIISGDEVIQLSPEQLLKKVEEVDIYARMFPEAKLKVIKALKHNNSTIAMTGDGVNDGPALKAADIGIAMGAKGTEIAKDAADLVITDDNLEKITSAITHGRKIYSNLKKAIRYIISIHIPIVFISAIPLLLGWKYANVFSPIHIIFLELIMGPTCSVFFEREPAELNLMSLPPRPRTPQIFSLQELLVSFLQGSAIAASILLFYYFLMSHGYQIEYVRTAVFTSLLYSNVFLTFVNRSFTRSILQTIRVQNSLSKYVLAVSAAFLLIIQVDLVRNIFQLTAISPTHYLLCILIGLFSTCWIEFFKQYHGHRY